jgi:N-acetylneuraminate lyase
MKLEGSVFAALLTPFEDDGSVSARRIPGLVDFVLSKGVHGLYAGGSTGEAMLQSREERAFHLEALAEHARGRCTLIAHVGSASTSDSVALSKVAMATGYHAVSAVPPYYYRHGFDDIAAYYRSIADAAGLPVIIYNVPVLSGTDLPTDRLLELMEDDRIAGAKFTAQDLFQFQRLRALAPNKRFYFGTDEMFLGAAAMGTDGGIGSTYNLIGDVYLGIEAAVNDGNIERARQLQNKANELVAILMQSGAIPGLKYALDRIGVPVGPCRAPFGAPTGGAAALLDTWLADNGHLW